MFSYPVKQVVLMGRSAYLSLFAVPSKADEAIAQQALERLGVAHLAEQSFAQISGGEQQMVLIARALAQ
ncbi:MAG: ATP-binding cassette domain-containing protein, partial [Butyricicoccus sp.]